MFGQPDFDRLLAYEDWPAVTLLLPLHLNGRETRQDPIRLRNLLEAAQEHLMEHDMRPGDAERLLQPVRALAAEGGFWREQALGLAIFAGKGVFEHFKLPFEVPEEVMVAPRFHLRHLLPFLEGDGPFFVLTATSRRARFFEATRHQMTERKYAGLPKGVESEAAITDFEGTREARPVARKGMGAGSGRMPADSFGPDGEQIRKTELMRYLQHLADAVAQITAGRTPPLVFAASEEIQGQFRRLAHLPALLAEGIVENPDRLTDAELHDRGYALVAPHFVSGREPDFNRFNMLYGSGDSRASVAPDGIVQAAGFDRVETLFLADGVHLWGAIDESSGEMAWREEPSAGDQDILDFAATKTLKNGGHVYVLSPGQTPFSLPMAAILRY